jgi:prepilin-type processing-associated H-X9-DG protein
MHRAFSLREVLLVAVVTAILAVLIYPVFLQSREINHRPQCRTHLKQIGMALTMYLQDYDNRLPPHGYVVGTQAHTLPGLLNPYLKNYQLWECPVAADAGDKQGTFDGTTADTTVHYGYNWSAFELNGVGRLASTFHQPDATLAFADSSSYQTAPSALVPVLGGTPPVYRHSHSANVVWLDGHVKSMAQPKLEEAPGIEDGQALSSGIDAFRYWNRW